MNDNLAKRIEAAIEKLKKDGLTFHTSDGSRRESNYRNLFTQANLNTKLAPSPLREFVYEAFEYVVQDEQVIKAIPKDGYTLTLLGQDMPAPGNQEDYYILSHGDRQIVLKHSHDLQYDLYCEVSEDLGCIPEYLLKEFSEEKFEDHEVI